MIVGWNLCFLQAIVVISSTYLINSYSLQFRYWIFFPSHRYVSFLFNSQGFYFVLFFFCFLFFLRKNELEICIIIQFGQANNFISICGWFRFVHGWCLTECVGWKWTNWKQVSNVCNRMSISVFTSTRRLKKLNKIITNKRDKGFHGLVFFGWVYKSRRTI